VGPIRGEFADKDSVVHYPESSRPGQWQWPTRHDRSLQIVVEKHVQPKSCVEIEDTPDALAGRVLIEEHKIYPLAVKLIAEGRVSVENGAVKIKNAVNPDSAIINPS
jgi:hypothetical protein